MPPDERCRWSDISVLLDGTLAQRYRRLPCEERGAFEQRLWWLAQPLYSLPGNDRRTEHLARATMARIERDAGSTYGVPWSDDLREMTLRFGWPSYWTREDPTTLGGLADPPITFHEPEPAFHFLPDAHAFDDPGSSTGDDWALDPDYPRRARERYAPRYAAAVASLTHQVALFPRGDSCLVVAAYDLSRDTLFGGGDALDAALGRIRDEGSEPVMERRPGAGPSAETAAKADCAPRPSSLEVGAATPRPTARAPWGWRAAAHPCGSSGRRCRISAARSPGARWRSSWLASRRGATASRSCCARRAIGAPARRGKSWSRGGENGGNALRCARMKLPILLYHKIDRIPPGSRYPKNYVTPEQFAAQLAFLARRGYTSTTFADYLAYRRGERLLPRRAVIITFDDGYRSNRTIALPLLRQYGFGATIFLVTAYVGMTNRWDADEIQEPLLDAADVRAMQAAGIDFGSHTATHVRLATLRPVEALRELRTSRERLGALLGKPVSVVGYPYGDYNRETMQFARDAGYEAGVIIRRRMNTDATDVLELRRIPITCLTSPGRFAWDLFRLRWFHGS